MGTLVTVVIPCYNQASFLKDAIDSALTQGYSDTEIIMINDGSPDNTREAALAYGDYIVYVEQENRGVSAARNRGIRQASGEYIAFLDSDDRLAEGSLAKRAAFLDAHGDIAMVCGDSFVLKENEVAGLISEVAGKPKDPNNFRWETVHFYPIPSTVMIRKSCFDKAGFFDEYLKNAAEDWLMWVKLSLYFNLAYIEEPLAFYRIHADNVTKKKDIINEGQRYAVDAVVKSPEFILYPRKIRAQLLFFRFATAWRVESKGAAFSYFLRALKADPMAIGFGLRRIGLGLQNTVARLKDKNCHV